MSDILPANTRNKSHHLDAILEHYRDPSLPLTPAQDRIRERLAAAWTLMRQRHSMSEAARILVEQFDISESQAFRDIRESLTLYGDALRSEKEGIRHIVYDYAVEAYALATRQKDAKAMASSLKIMVSVYNLDKDDPDLPDFSRLQPSAYAIVIDEKTRELINRLAGADTGVIDLSATASTLFAEDIDFEDVTT